MRLVGQRKHVFVRVLSLLFWYLIGFAVGIHPDQNRCSQVKSKASRISMDQWNSWLIEEISQAVGLEN
jgi:hypothetical protein